MIDKYLRPLLEAKETKLAQYEGQYTDFVVLDDNTTSLAATNMAFKLLGAYPPKDPVLAAKTTVDVIICDMPETKYDKEPIDVRPTVRPPREEIVNARPTEKAAEPFSNGGKCDPRPKD